jgi:endonuclease/exonuclease/phosphatase family metal-dependent hydrolase
MAIGNRWAERCDHDGVQRGAWTAYSRAVANDTLTILTYNIFNHSEGPNAFEHRAQQLIASIGDIEPDVVCIQEAPDTAFLRRLMAALTQRQQRVMRVASTRMERRDGWSEHLAIFHPGTMKVATVHAAPTGEHIGLSVVLAGSAVTVMNIHLNPHSGETRREQASMLMEALPEGPVVVCGDFNAVRDGGTLALFREKLEVLAPGDAVATTFPTPLRKETEANPGAVLDHILARGMRMEESGLVGAEPVKEKWASDHIGVWARLRLA